MRITRPRKRVVASKIDDCLTYDRCLICRTGMVCPRSVVTKVVTSEDKVIFLRFFGQLITLIYSIRVALMIT